MALQLLAGGSIAWAVNARAGHKTDETRALPPGAATPTVAPTSPPPSPGADITGPLDLVLVGVDTRVSVPDWQPHADTVMLLHVERGLEKAYLYSLPRDLRVRVPAFPKSGYGGGTHKLTESMSLGSKVPGNGPPNAAQGYELLVRTLTAYTGIKQFHAGAVLNFGGLAELTNLLGGIDLVVDQKVESRHRRPDGKLRPMRPGGGDYTGPQAVYLPGKQRMKGWQAIDYARQRYGLPNGDYDRTRHQRQLVKALLTKAQEQGLATDPAKLENIIWSLGQSLISVGGRRPFEYAYALRNLGSAGLTLVDLPGAGVGRGGAYRGEQLTAESRGFVKAVADDDVAAYLAAHPKLVNKG